jgi:hypothetical protein
MNNNNSKGPWTSYNGATGFSNCTHEKDYIAAFNMWWRLFRPDTGAAVKNFNARHPGHGLRYDGEQSRSEINKPPMHSFTAFAGPAKGYTFSVEKPTVENIKAKLDEIITIRIAVALVA